MALFLALVAAAASAGACAPVAGDRVQARDLAPVWPELANGAPDQLLFYSPRPGARRWISAAELKRLAARFGVVAPAGAGICVVRSAQVLTPAALETALRETLGGAAQIEVQDFSRQAAPQGKLEFTLAGLDTHGSVQPLLWRGRIVYGQGRYAPVWVRARILVRTARVVAAADLFPGRPLKASQIKLVDYSGPPSRTRWAASLDEAVGRLPRRRIASGSAIQADDLEEAPAILRGDTVTVEVRSGAARLSFAGRAESAGRVGQWIEIRNLKSGRAFPARVSGPGRALVVPDVPPAGAAHSRSSS